MQQVKRLNLGFNLNINIHKEIYSVLKKYWNFESFRPLQEEIITSVLQKKDTLALLPTGGGKSLCFQVPGLVLGGTCLVVSPLIALMNDQVSNLKRKGISAVAISASMSFKEIEIALNNAALGHVQFLYVSPERLQNEAFRKSLSYLPITLIAIDEAHCISQWGYDFRPSYLKIAEVKDYFNQVAMVALTASATKFVVSDIQQKLEFKNPNVFRQSFYRKNLRYVVQYEEDKFSRLLKIIKNIGGSGVVYVRNRKRTQELALQLTKNKISASSYHAGLTFSDRQTIQQNWIDNKTQVICATNAFGMGIDKPDVRFVAHMDLPDSLEAYFQEAGRGGRDGKTAYASLFFTNGDIERLQDNFKTMFPEIEYIKLAYNAICNYYQIAANSGQGLSFEFDLDKVCASYNLRPVLVYNSIKFLEKENYLSYLDAGFEQSKLMMVMGKEDLYNFQIKFSKYEPLIKTVLRNYGGIFENYVFINEKDLAYKVKLPASKVIEYLNLLTKQGVLSYIPQTNLPKIIFLENRINNKHIEINPKNYHTLKERYLERMNAVINYVDNNKVCRNIQLLIYFNEIDYTDCGYCDVCIANRPKDYSTIKSKIVTMIKKNPITIVQLKEKFQQYNLTTFVTAYNDLMDDGIIKESEGLIYKRK